METAIATLKLAMTLLSMVQSTPNISPEFRAYAINTANYTITYVQGYISNLPSNLTVDNSVQKRQEEISYRQGEITRLQNEIVMVKKDLADRKESDERNNQSNFFKTSNEYQVYELDRLAYIKTIENKISVFQSEINNL